MILKKNHTAIQIDNKWIKLIDSPLGIFVSLIGPISMFGPLFLFFYGQGKELSVPSNIGIPICFTVTLVCSFVSLMVFQAVRKATQFPKIPL